MNILISNLPKYIVFWWVILICIHKSDFYYYNYITIDKIDTFLVAMSLFHFILKSEFYNLKKITFIVCIFLILQLQLFNYLLTENQYYFTYKIIIFITIFKAYVIRTRETLQN